MTRMGALALRALVIGAGAAGSDLVHTRPTERAKDDLHEVRALRVELNAERLQGKEGRLVLGAERLGGDTLRVEHVAPLLRSATLEVDCLRQLFDLAP